MADPATAMLERALAYAARGWRVFPLRGKVPAIPGGRGCLDATTDPEQIRAWWLEHPEANVGIATGPESGLLVIDVDGPEARRAWLALAARHDPIETPTSRTGRPDGGVHVIFRWPDGEHVPNRSQGAWSARVLGDRAIEVIGAGRYIVAPGSLHASGARYAWLHDSGDLAPAELPAWLRALLVERVGSDPERPTWQPRDDRDATRARAYCLAALRGAHDEVARLPLGERNAGLVREAYKLGGLVPSGFLEVHEVREALRSACAHWPPQERDVRKDLGTIDRGLHAGMAAPRAIELRDPPAAATSPPPPDDAPHPADDGEQRPPFGGQPLPPLPPEPHWLSVEWLSVQQRPGEWLEVEPPPREWILRRGDVPLLERGIVGLFVAPGGRGKTMAIVDLALAVATGGRWLGHYEVATPGRVVLALGEESEAEVRRRLYYVARARGMDDADRALAASRIVALGLRARHVALVEADARHGVTPTDLHVELRRLLAGEEHPLVLLDPLARWAPGVEGDSAIATRAIELLEDLAAAARGSVLVVHHTAKWSRREGGGGELASSARGVTALVDGPRLVLELVGAGEHDLAIAVTKGNGVPPQDPVRLVRDPQTGALRAEHATERAAREDGEAYDEEQDARLEALMQAIERALVTSRGSVTTRADLLNLIKARRSDAQQAVSRLLAEGRIVGGRGAPYRVDLTRQEVGSAS